MARAPTGFLGRVAAERPFLTTAILALAMTSLCIIGVRRSADPNTAFVVTEFIVSALFAIAAPMAFAAIAPKAKAARIGFIFVVLAVAGALLALERGVVGAPAFFSPPPALLTVTATLFFCFLMTLAPFLSNVLKLGVAAPFAAALGAAGALGYLTLEGMLTGASSTMGVALAVGVIIGADVSAEFSKFFAKGASRQAAAGAAGHAAVAPTVFSILAIGAFLIVQSAHMNFGLVEWRMLWGGFAAALLVAVMSLIGVIGSLSIARLGELVAVDENRRRQWFESAWRPMRFLLPATTALAATAIVGVSVVVAVFEAGVEAPFSLLFYLTLIAIAAALAFVSLRSCILIVAILFAATILAGYVYAVFDRPGPDLPERLAALTLTAVGLGHLTVSWRNAGDVWRNMRDITQHAMSDGLRRFLLALGLGASSLTVASHAFDWANGSDTVVYFMATSLISLLLAPIMMTAMSAKTRRY